MKQPRFICIDGNSEAERIAAKFVRGKKRQAECAQEIGQLVNSRLADATGVPPGPPDPSRAAYRTFA